MYQTAKDRQEEQKSIALLWLFIHSKEMYQDFIEFCREKKGLPLAEIERQLRAIVNYQTK